MKKLYYVKGDRIRARWFETTMASLSGSQPKIGAVERTLTGTVKHVRGDRPVEPTSIRVYVDPDEAWDGKRISIDCTCGHPHVELKTEWVTEVL